MNITVTTQSIPQSITVTPESFKGVTTVHPALRALSEVSIIGIPGPPGPEGPPSDQITVSATPPSSPDVNDLWVDLS